MIKNRTDARAFLSIFHSYIPNLLEVLCDWHSLHTRHDLLPDLPGPALHQGDCHGRLLLLIRRPSARSQNRPHNKKIRKQTMRKILISRIDGRKHQFVAHEIREDWIPTQRFEVVQKNKVRVAIAQQLTWSTKPRWSPRSFSCRPQNPTLLHCVSSEQCALAPSWQVGFWWEKSVPSSSYTLGWSLSGFMMINAVLNQCTLWNLPIRSLSMFTGGWAWSLIRKSFNWVNRLQSLVSPIACLFWRSRTTVSLTWLTRLTTF